MRTELSDALSSVRMACVLGLLFAGLLSSPAMADRGGGGDGWQLRLDQRNVHRPPSSPPPHQVTTPRRGDEIRHFDRIERNHDLYRSPYWDLDMRFRHDRYYPRRGYIVDALPPGYLSVIYRGGHFYFQAGVWFRAVGPNFVVTMPPVGIVAPVLPPAYTTVWLDSVPYYYANDVYYVRRASAPGYVVVDPPLNIDTAVVDSTETIEPVTDNASDEGTTTAIKVVPSPTTKVTQADDGLSIVYPNKGQSLARMERDRSECGRKATEMSGYDSANDDSGQYGEFQRLLRSCLEDRGYTVK